VEVYDLPNNQWSVIDPTFGLIPHRNSDGGVATSADLSSAARAMNWSSINYELLTPAADAYARNYYLDYPSLFVNVYIPGSTTTLIQSPPDIAPYYTSLHGNSAAGLGYYALQC